MLGSVQRLEAPQASDFVSGVSPDAIDSQPYVPARTHEAMPVITWPFTTTLATFNQSYLRYIDTYLHITYTCIFTYRERERESLTTPTSTVSASQSKPKNQNIWSQQMFEQNVLSTV